MGRLYEEKTFVPMLISADINAGTDTDSILVKDHDHATFVFMFGADLSGDAILTINSGATDGAKTTALTFPYRYGSAATGSATSDVLTDEATSAALTLTGATYLSRILVCEVDIQNLTDGHDWITINVSNAASAGTLTVVGILNRNYKSSRSVTVLS